MSALHQGDIRRMTSRGRHGRLARLGPRSVRRRLHSNRVFRAWLIAWIGGSVLGVVNGTARELLYKDAVGEQAANYISTATLIALLALYVWILERRWPIPTLRIAYKIGGIWWVLTILFEFGFGHYVDGKSWAELLHNYNVADGEVWVLVLLWMAVAPAVVRALHSKIGGLE